MEVITNPEHLKAVGGGLIGSPDVRLLEAGQIGSANGGGSNASYGGGGGGGGITITGSLWEGVVTAVKDCGVGASAAKIGNDFLGVVSSSTAGMIGCTVGIGAGIIRDIRNK
jgi:hypothetical protein